MARGPRYYAPTPVSNRTSEPSDILRKRYTHNRPKSPFHPPTAPRTPDSPAARRELPHASKSPHQAAPPPLTNSRSPSATSPSPGTSSHRPLSSTPLHVMQTTRSYPS